MHLDHETLELLIHGELRFEDRVATEAHLAACPECQNLRADLTEEWQQIRRSVALLDDPAPPVDVSDLVARAHRRRPSVRRWAAGIVLGLAAAGGVYAAPGSPVSSWVARLTHVEPREAEVQPGSASGVVVTPGSSLEVVFSQRPESGTITFVMTDAAEVSVRVENGTATYDAGPERLVIDANDSTIDYRIMVPIAAPNVRVRIADTEVFAARSGRVTTSARVESAESYVLSFDEPR